MRVIARTKFQVCTEILPVHFHRVSELVGLRWEDVHRQAITVDERYCRGDWSITKTAASNAAISVDESVIARIEALKSLEVCVNWGGKGAKRRIKLVRTSGHRIWFSNP